MFSTPLSSKSKIINHLPEDKISCLMAEQLQHLVVVLRWGAFQVSPSPSRLWVDPELGSHPAKHHAHAAQVIRQKKKRGKKKKIKQTQPTSPSPSWIHLTSAHVKSPRRIHVTSQGVHAPEGDSPRWMHMGRWSVSKHSSYLLRESREQVVRPPRLKCIISANRGAMGRGRIILFLNSSWRWTTEEGEMSLTSNRQTKTTVQMIFFFCSIYNLLGIHIRPLCYQNNLVPKGKTLTDTFFFFFFFKGIYCKRHWFTADEKKSGQVLTRGLQSKGR